MVMNRDAKFRSGINDFPRHIDIGDRWGGIAGGMIVDHPYRLSKKMFLKEKTAVNRWQGAVCEALVGRFAALLGFEVSSALGRTDVR